MNIDKQEIKLCRLCCDILGEAEEGVHSNEESCYTTMMIKSQLYNQIIMRFAHFAQASSIVKKAQTEWNEAKLPQSKTVAEQNFAVAMEATKAANDELMEFINNCLLGKVNVSFNKEQTEETLLSAINPRDFGIDDLLAKRLQKAQVTSLQEVYVLAKTNQLSQVGVQEAQQDEIIQAIAAHFPADMIAELDSIAAEEVDDKRGA